MKNALIIGTGGQARAIISILRQFKGRSISGLISLDGCNTDLIMGCPIIASVNEIDAVLRDHLDNDFFLAIGNNHTREYWWKKLKALGCIVPNLIASTAFVDPSAKLGEGNIISSFSFVGPETTLGDNNIINTGSIVEHRSSIGSHCHLAPSSTLCGSVSVDDSCSIGAGSTILPLVKIYRGIQVGAGSTVLKNLSTANGVYAGVPARLIGGGGV